MEAVGHNEPDICFSHNQIDSSAPLGMTRRTVVFKLIIKSWQFPPKAEQNFRAKAFLLGYSKVFQIGRASCRERV